MALVFYNTSVLPLECISTFGVSAKETDSPIGYFGTGLKYAIATLLRENCKITMFIEGKEYAFTTEQQSVRNKEFGFIYMNGDPLPFTIELGKNWQLWQAYRELYSNCKDEDGEVLIKFEVDPNHGTLIVVDGLDEIHAASSTFILRSEPKYVVDEVEIHESASTSGVFYKGIKVLDLPTKFTYNVRRGLTLTEDRTVSQYSAEYAITTAISDSSNLEMLMDILTITDEQYHEAKFNWDKYHTPSEAFMRLVAKLQDRSHALGSYFSHQESRFLGKLERGMLSDVVTRKLNKLRASVKFKPSEIFIANMDRDYRIIPEGLVLNAELLVHPKKLNFIYRLACIRMEKKISEYTDDTKVIIEHMLGDFHFTTLRQRQMKNSARKKAA